MVRAPCCEKMGVKRGPWATEEDQILISYVNQYGHGNWRALPKQAGLLRCGKSCRLRWTNYLRPDIKRGNFSREEEDTIIKLHEMLGNRWSAIAARLPGRTDNEIKNVWHTHLKKRVVNQTQQATLETKPQNSNQIHEDDQLVTKEEPEPQPINYPIQMGRESPQSSANDTSSSATTTATSGNEFNYFPEADENFWGDVFSTDNSSVTSDFPVDSQWGFQFSPVHGTENVNGYNSGLHEVNEFWFNIFTTAEELQELPQF